MRFRKAIGVFLFALLQTSCGSQESNSLVIQEDFSTLTYADLSASSGVWNIVAKRAHAGITPNGDFSRLVSFGDGSDGVVETSDNYTFDTDKHPNGYNFQSLKILGGTITIQGSNPLIIRSLGDVMILPTLDISGGAGTSGSVTSAGGTGAAGGYAKAGKAHGGRGGSAISGGSVAAMTAEGGLTTTGAVDTSTPGAGSNAGVAADSASSGAGRPQNDFDLSGKFISGTGGGGGGGQFNAGDAAQATGGGGGAGGGTLRIIAVGTITLRTILARGGSGGNAAASTSACSGAGGGGNGGGVWLQSLSGYDAPTAPTVTGGTGGSAAGACGTAGSTGLTGTFRADGPPGGKPSWATAGTHLDSTKASVGKTFYVQSKAYSLGVLNAEFGDTELDSTSQGGGIGIEYSGSSDGYTYTAFSNQLSSLNGQNIRYLKFKIGLTPTNLSTPFVSKITIPYKEFGNKTAKFDLGFGF